MTIRFTPDLPVRLHDGEASGISFILSAILPPLFLGEIVVSNDTSLGAVTGPYTAGTSATNPGRADVRVAPSKYEELLLLARQPDSVKLLVKLTFDDADPKRVTNITCRKAGGAHTSVVNSSVSTDDATPAE